MIDFIKKYIEDRNENLLKRKIKGLRINPEGFKGEKFIKTKYSQSIYFVHLNFGILGVIKILSIKGYLGKLSYTLNNSGGKRAINIGDIQYKLVNQGIGSELINYLEEIADGEKVTYLTGWISPVDFDHKERLLHFYQKNGFEIRAREDEMGGYYISKSL